MLAYPGRSEPPFDPTRHPLQSLAPNTPKPANPTQHDPRIPQNSAPQTQHRKTQDPYTFKSIQPPAPVNRRRAGGTLTAECMGGDSLGGEEYRLALRDRRLGALIAFKDSPFGRASRSMRSRRRRPRTCRPGAPQLVGKLPCQPGRAWMAAYQGRASCSFCTEVQLKRGRGKIGTFTVSLSVVGQ